jgi:hypothetical protein
MTDSYVLLESGQRVYLEDMTGYMLLESETEVATWTDVSRETGDTWADVARQT